MKDPYRYTLLHQRQHNSGGYIVEGNWRQPSGLRAWQKTGGGATNVHYHRHAIKNINGSPRPDRPGQPGHDRRRSHPAVCANISGNTFTGIAGQAGKWGIFAV